MLCVIPIPIVRWVLVGGAFGLSGYFLFRNVYPILTSVCSIPSDSIILTMLYYIDRTKGDTSARHHSCRDTCCRNLALQSPIFQLLRDRRHGRKGSFRRRERSNINGDGVEYANFHIMMNLLTRNGNYSFVYRWIRATKGAVFGERIQRKCL